MPTLPPDPGRASTARRRSAAAACALAALLTGCAVGPDYVRPTVDTPPAFKEQGWTWQAAQPRPVDSAHPWWKLYQDPALDALVDQANRASPTIAQAEAQYRQAQALAAGARAAQYPSVGYAAGGSRAQTNNAGSRLGNGVSVGLNAAWEPDFWGGVRRAVEAGAAGEQASADDLAAARLSLQALVAQDYFLLRATDDEVALYERTVAAYRRALELTQRQYAVGVALRSDVAAAETQLQAAEAQRLDLTLQRTQLEHALAVLTGRAPAAFSLGAAPDAPAVLPPIPPLLPSELLERRPDIAAAERRAAQANAAIGVARAAWYPAVTLGAAAGYSWPSAGQLFDTPARVWSIGLALAGSLFDGGLRQAHDAQVVAAWDAAVAQYRQTVLASFQEVEDNLAAQRLLADEAAAQDKAVQAARLTERLALDQYRAGTATYLGVVVAQAASLANQRAAALLRGRRQVASVALVKAIGGGWNPADAAPIARVP